MRTLSARILTGFAVLIVTFAVTSTLVLRYMNDVGVEIGVIRTGYLQLALQSKDFSRREEDLRSYVAEDLSDEGNAKRAAARLAGLRGRRDKLLAGTFAILNDLHDVPERHAARLAETRRRLDAIQSAIDAAAPLYAKLLDEVPLEVPGGEPSPTDTPSKRAAREALAQLRSQETIINTRANDLADHQKQEVVRTADSLERNETRLRMYTAYLGGTAILVGLLITVWATITLRPLRRLRDAARRIAAGDYGSRIEERGPAEVADLAREFNAMGRAVEERQHQVVRAERMVTVGKMAAMITHEVRNPLSSIGLNTELLDEELAARPDTEEARALCKAITREVDRLTELTEEYLAFARLPKPRLEVHAVGEVVAKLAEFVRDDLAARKVALVVELADDGAAAQVDPNQLRQCLLNLVRNAAEAIAQKGSGTVTIRTTRQGAQVAIAVRDDGPGVATEVAARLFDPFVSTKERGTGLGLALTHQIIADHGGAITVDSAPGAGAMFTITMPRVASAAGSGDHGAPGDAREAVRRT